MKQHSVFLLPKVHLKKLQPTPGPSRLPLLNGYMFLGKCPKNKYRNKINKSHHRLSHDKNAFNRKQGKSMISRRVTVTDV